MENKCGVCGKGPDDGVPIYPTGKLGPGEDPRLRCQQDLTVGVKTPTTVEEMMAAMQRRHVPNTNSISIRKK